MDPQELAGERETFQVVDVRYPNEWDAGHIEGVLHIPEHELEDRLDELDRDRPVVTVCRTGARSGEAATFLRGEGFDAQNMDGGMEAWEKAGLPLRAADGGRGRVVEPQPPPDDRPEEVQRLQGAFLEAIFAVQEHFGDREPSDEEVKEFLRDRLISEGKSLDEAERILSNRPEEG